MSISNLPDSIKHLRDHIRYYLFKNIDIIYFVRIFSGVMNLDDFVDYVVFELCAEQYLQSAKTYSLLHHIKHITEDHKHYLHDLQSMDLHSKKIKSIEAFDENSLYHGLRPYLSDMIDRRLTEHNNAKKQSNDPDVPETVGNLYDFDYSDPKQLWNGYPITTVHFLQTYTSYVLGIKHAKYVLRSGNKNFNAEKARAFYERQDYFLEFISSKVYQDHMTAEECDRYIANAINLSRYENAYFRNTLYTYTYHLPTEQRPPSFITGSIPPIFLGAIGTYGAATHCVAEHYLPLHLLETAPSTQNMNIRKPYLFLKDYAEIFASAEASQRHEEELRYYSIQILAAGIVRLLKNHPSVSNVTPKDFAWFIHNRYNIVDEMLHQALLHNEFGFNANMLSAMRAITKDHETQYGFTE